MKSPFSLHHKGIKGTGPTSYCRGGTAVQLPAGRTGPAPSRLHFCILLSEREGQPGTSGQAVMPTETCSHTLKIQTGRLLIKWNHCTLIKLQCFISDLSFVIFNSFKGQSDDRGKEDLIFFRMALAWRVQALQKGQVCFFPRKNGFLILSQPFKMTSPHILLWNNHVLASVLHLNLYLAMFSFPIWISLILAYPDFIETPLLVALSKLLTKCLLGSSYRIDFFFLQIQLLFRREVRLWYLIINIDIVIVEW